MAHDKFFIDGGWVAASGSETIDVLNPATEEVIATLPLATPDDVDRAVAAARRAFKTWSQTTTEERATYLERIAAGLKAREEDFAKTMASEMGMPLKGALAIQVGLPVRTFSSYVGITRDYAFESGDGATRIIREPIGVCGFITPWNYPMHQIAGKVAPALAAGCTVVLKPSEMAPLNAYLLAEVIEEAGLPPGVFNLLNGVGPVAGEAIASHPDVDMVSFTGSTRAGKRVAELAAQTVKRVTQELGGKSPNIILEDADLEKAIPAGVMGCYANSGQTCSAPTRMIVPRARLAEVEALAKAAAESVTMGDPFDPDSTHGPIVHAAQYGKVQDLIQVGIDEGAKLLTGGTGRPDNVERGYFVKPTVFSDVSNDMTIARDEVFGPVLTIIPYDTEDEAVGIANDTIYGLAGRVWGSDHDRARAVARQIRAGQIHINEGRGSGEPAPFGGYKQSGNGREFGTFGLEEYLEVKAVMGW
ncbi:MAG: aldehyde dehydrogenase family protein [Dehalococcoidia bacterium]|nr:aldehyde dehydrogenase family protein [Dehalococcoidia bacterium]